MWFFHFVPFTTAHSIQLKTSAGLLQRQDNFYDHWIGLTNFNERNTYEWTDGTPMAFTYWREEDIKAPLIKIILYSIILHSI